MNKLKLVLAWLDWSTYCKSEGKTYEFPFSLCSIFWRTALSIVALPFTWFTHVWNKITVKNEKFLNEESVGQKLNIWTTIVFTVLVLVFGALVHDVTDGKDGSGGLGWDFFHNTDPFMLSYFKLIGAGIVGIIIISIILGIILGVVYLIYLLIVSIKKLLTESKGNVEDGNFVPSEERAIPRLIGAIKNKYCPTIDWSSIRSKK